MTTAALPAESSDGVVTMAYLFTLRRARHPLFHSWNAYFDSCPQGSFRILLHVDPSFSLNESSKLGGREKQGAHFGRAELVTNPVVVDRM
eukprot:3824989-Prymnesium_polylepis.1